MRPPRVPAVLLLAVVAAASALFLVRNPERAPLDVAFYTRQLDELRDSLQVTGPVDLVALSFGGVETGHHVPARHARVRTLTLVEPVASSTPVPGPLSSPLVGSRV